MQSLPCHVLVTYASPIGVNANLIYSNFFQQVPKQVAKQECKNVPRQVPKEECKNVPRQECKNVPKQVPKQECKQVPRQVNYIFSCCCFYLAQPWRLFVRCQIYSSHCYELDHKPRSNVDVEQTALWLLLFASIRIRISGIRRIWTWIYKVDGKSTDHLTTTKTKQCII